MKFDTKKMVTLAMLSAVSVILVMLIRIPWPGVPFLEYDPADVPILISTFIYGPVAGLIVTFVVSVLQGVTVSASSQIIGIIMHILATGAYVIVAGVVNKKATEKTKVTAAVVIGALVSTLTMILWNLWFTPIFMGAPREVVLSLMLPAIIPFNLIKTFGNGIVAALVYSVLKRTVFNKK